MTRSNATTTNKLCMTPSAVETSLIKSHKFIIIKMQELEKKLLKIKKIQDLFMFKDQQVDVIIALLWSRKLREYPVGMNLQEIEMGLREENHYFLYKDNKYLARLLNTMSSYPVGLLDMSINGTFNLTEFSIDYFLEGDNNY
jgi:hypothetical protein